MTTEGEIQRYISTVRWAVEATDDERHLLWYRWTHPEACQWKSVSMGYYTEIARLGKRPIVLTLGKAIVNGVEVLFYYPSSELVDWSIIRSWIKDNLPEGCQTTNASNFGRVLRTTKGG